MWNKPELEGPRVEVYKIQGELRELIRTFRSKSRAIRFAQQLAKEVSIVPRGTKSKIEVLIVTPEIHLKMAHTKRVVPLGHEVIKQLTAAWLEATHGITRIYNEKTVGGRKLDLVLANFSRPSFRIFVEVESKPVREEYLRKFFDFCRRHKPNKAFIISPVLQRHEMNWVDPKLSYRPTLQVIPTSQLFEEVGKLYSIKFEKLAGEVVLALIPDKETILRLRPKE